MTSDNDKTLHGTFGAKTIDRVEQNYAADPDQARALIGQLRTLLQASPAARRLFDVADQYGMVVRFIKGREESVYVPEGKWVFMSVTPKTMPTTRLALMYAGALREAEQNIMGHSRPTKDVGDGQWLTANLVKNLDIITNMCIIVSEIVKQNQEHADFLDSLKSLGHDEIYEAFVNNAPEEELLRLLAKKEQLNINEG